MKKEESRQGQSLIFEGMTSISAVINGGYRKIEQVFIDKEKASSKKRQIDFLIHKSRELGFTVEYTTESEIDEMTTGSSHGGIIARCTDREIEPLCALEPEEDGFYVMIDGIEDPYNFGYALRTVYAAGADAVILTPRNWMSAAGVVCRSSAGASELLPLYVSEGEEACTFFKNNNIKVVCAGIRNSVSAFDADLKKPLFLIVGGEKRGISAKVLDCADTVVRLDYGRDFSGSLSAASAASVLAYEILRQNRE
ncbi:MAG: RNA methyltransferase [Ruminococcaceae bacterium]|nr:RNA methyltransferase [Oscillospiraceae bacterium]